MWLPLRLVLEYVGRSAAWLAVLAAIGAAAAVLVVIAARRPLRSVWPGPAAGAIVGALLAASLADRIGLPEPFAFQVWCRWVPLVWSAGGALLGAILAALLSRAAPAPRPERTAAPDDQPSPPPRPAGE